MPITVSSLFLALFRKFRTGWDRVRSRAERRKALACLIAIADRIKSDWAELVDVDSANDQSRPIKTAEKSAKT